MVSKYYIHNWKQAKLCTYRDNKLDKFLENKSSKESLNYVPQCEKLQKITLLKPFFKKLREILIQQLVFSLHTFQMWVKFMIFNTVRWEQEKLFFLTSSDENEQNRDKKLHLKQRRPHTCSHFQMISNFFSESNRNSFSKWACFTTFSKIKNFVHFSEWKFLFGQNQSSQDSSKNLGS